MASRIYYYILFTSVGIGHRKLRLREVKPLDQVMQIVGHRAKIQAQSLAPGSMSLTTSLFSLMHHNLGVERKVYLLLD